MSAQKWMEQIYVVAGERGGVEKREGRKERMDRKSKPRSCSRAVRLKCFQGAVKERTPVTSVIGASLWSQQDTNKTSIKREVKPGANDTGCLSFYQSRQVQQWKPALVPTLRISEKYISVKSSGSFITKLYIKDKVIPEKPN